MGKADVIKFEGSNSELFSKLSLSLSTISSDARIVVNDTHNAILVKDGRMMDTLECGTYPVFEKRGLGSEKKDLHSLEVIYVSKSARLPLLWGTRSLIDARDPATGVSVALGANGQIELQMDNPRQFCLELVGAESNFTTDKLKQRVVGKVLSEFEPMLIRAVRDGTLSLDYLNETNGKLAAALLPTLNRQFMQSYGLRVCDFIISKILLPEPYRRAISEKLEGKKECKTEGTGKRFCPDCGTEATDGAAYCTGCGKKL